MGQASEHGQQHRELRLEASDHSDATALPSSFLSGSFFLYLKPSDNLGSRLCSVLFSSFLSFSFSFSLLFPFKLYIRRLSQRKWVCLACRVLAAQPPESCDYLDYIAAFFFFTSLILFYFQPKWPHPLPLSLLFLLPFIFPFSTFSLSVPYKSLILLCFSLLTHTHSN